MPRFRRAVLACAVALAFGLHAWWFWRHMPATASSDLDQLHSAARFLLEGRDPYANIGKGRAFDWPFPLLYPLTAAVPLLPFAPLDLRTVVTLWPAIGFGVLAYALAGREQPIVGLLGLLSVPALNAAASAQWTPLLTAAMLLPPVAVLVAAKPTTALAIVAVAGRRPIVWALGGGLVLLAISLAFDPAWPAKWLAALPAGTHIKPPLIRIGGPLLALALLCWRDPGARLLLALACAPQTPVFYEALPLLLIPRTPREQMGLGIAGFAALAWRMNGPSFPGPTDAYFDYAWLATFAGCYLPALLLVLWHGWTDAHRPRNR